MTSRRRAALLPLALTCLLADGGLRAAHAQANPFIPGNLVVAVEGCGVYGGTCAVPNGTGTGAQNSSLGGYGDNQAAPLTLFQFAPLGTSSATFVNALALPQSASGPNLPVSGEYGSSSEATLQLSGNGEYLTVFGYGIPAATFNAAPATYGAAPSLALAQSGSLTNQGYTPIPRVLALIDSRGNVSSSTAIYNIFNTNNPRSGFTANGSTVYASGQGASGDATGGVFLTRIGGVMLYPTPITGLDTTSNTVAQDTRTIQIVNNTLYVSVDTKAGSGSARSFIGTLGAAGTPPINTVGAPVMLSGFGNSGGTGQVTINNNGNNINANGQTINISPSNYFFATPAILYVADTGNGKQTSASSRNGDGGLQKWINSKSDGSGTWSLAYTLYQGLNLIADTNTDGVSGLYGLTGRVVNGQVQLYATSFTLSDLDQTYLYGITDTLANTTAAQAAGETFSTLATAPQDSNFKGVSFAPTLAPETNLVAIPKVTSSGSYYLVTVQLANNGPATAEDVTVTNVTIGSTAASAGAPLDIGPLPAGNATTLSFLVPLTAGAHGAASVVRLTGTTASATFGASLRVTLP